MQQTVIRTTRLPGGASVPALGQGTWYLGEGRRPRAVEIEALRSGIDLGMTLIDTAEMYGDGRAEELVGEVIKGRRETVFLVSKVLPHNASRAGTIAACERSLKRLRTDRLDLYLLHWRGRYALAETVAAFEELTAAGKVRHWGVSNLDVDDMEVLISVPGGAAVQTNQVLYNPTRRGIELDLLPWCGERGIPIMAYSPIEQGRVLKDSTLRKIAARHDATPAQMALAWVLRRDDVIAIPRSGNPDHVRENFGALSVRLTQDDLDQIDACFPPPVRKVPLEML